MTETQKRIEAYKKALPEIRERVIAVALLFAMSMAMMTSATFAWLTISRAPEVTAVSTTVAANGNLEIALATGDGTTAPGESKVGDSSAAEGQSVTAANITWGNLVNLSDPSYGLDNLVLRPAQLNMASLLDSPLYGAVYSEDGRVSQLTSNFDYTSWIEKQGNIEAHFGISTEHGVRAISSTKTQVLGADETYKEILDRIDAVKAKNSLAANMYTSLSENEGYMNSLAAMIGTYMTAVLNESNPTFGKKDIENLRDLYEDFLSAFNMEAEAIVDLANLQCFLSKQPENYTVEEIYKSDSETLKNNGIVITNLGDFNDDRNTIINDLAKLEKLTNASAVYYKDLEEIIDNLVTVSSCTLDGTPVSNIGVSNALGYLDGETHDAEITNGILCRFEQRTGGYIEVKGLPVSAKLIFTVSIKANVKTNVDRRTNFFEQDITAAKAMINPDDIGETNIVAEDTYGLAIDLWVRTNAKNSYLTLEGNVLLSDPVNQDVYGTDANGDPVRIYTISVSIEESEGMDITQTIDIYKKETTQTDANGTEETIITWYDATNHSVITLEEGQIPNPKVEQVQTIIGYEGENRVWDSTMISVDATTQGSGSCYVYYADTPEDQARSLKLLESMKIVFTDESGTLLANGIMDTEKYYASNGRVTVPLVLDSGSGTTIEDEFGNTIHTITQLEQDVPTRITAIVYLEGNNLTNDEVLSTNDIQGQLNIQFGSSIALDPIKDSELENKILKISASTYPNYFDYDESSEDNPMTTSVTIEIEGDEPSAVTAFFVRQISSAQGTREKEMTFQKDDSSGKWVATHTFTAPGNYILRTVKLDGVDHNLSVDSTPPEVTISGFVVEDLYYKETTENHISVMTADSSRSVGLGLKFATDDNTKLPKTVQGRFINDDNGYAVNVNFKLNATSQTWEGNANFLTSGDYSMQYIIIDGNYMEIDSRLWKTASVTLGMQVAVYTTSPLTFKYLPDEMAVNESMLQMQIQIMDNTGKELQGLSGVRLYYGMKGSGIKTMDADLTWNGEYYEGEMTNGGPGIWQFKNVLVGSNNLTYDTTSPIFTIQSPKPPEYYDHITAKNQYSAKNEAEMNVQIKNSQSARVEAYIINDDETKGEWVSGEIRGGFEDGEDWVNNWYFKVPKDTVQGIQNVQDGNWTLTTLKLWDVFAADGTAYTAEDPLKIDVSEHDNKTNVISRIIIAFDEKKTDQSVILGKEDGIPIGQFMETHEFSGLKIRMHGLKGALDVSEVKMEYKYMGGSVANGGYSGENVPDPGTAVFTIHFVENTDLEEKKVTGSDGVGFIQSGVQQVQIAGKYVPVLTFKVKIGETYYDFEYEMPTTDYTLPHTDVNNGIISYTTLPTVEVYSVVPSVAITTISPKGTFDADTTGIGEGHQSVTVPNNTATNATVYFKCSRSGSGSTCDPYRHNYARPSVTITLAGIGNATKADLSFGEGVHIYNGTTQTTDYSWTANGACARNIGYYRSRTAASDDKTPAGTITASTLELTYGGETYNVPVPKITINNPY